MLFYFLGPSGKAVRHQFFPYVSSESDLQRYRAITFQKNASAETRTSSSISNVPSDSTKTRVSESTIVIIVMFFFFAYDIACIIFRTHSNLYKRLDDNFPSMNMNQMLSSSS
jgi:hypothetical protein